MGRRGERGYGGGGRGRLYTYCYTVTTRMTSALRWAAMRAILMFQKEVMDKVTRQCPQTATFFSQSKAYQCCVIYIYAYPTLWDVLWSSASERFNVKTTTQCCFAVQHIIQSQLKHQKVFLCQEPIFLQHVPVLLETREHLVQRLLAAVKYFHSVSMIGQLSWKRQNAHYTLK